MKTLNLLLLTFVMMMSACSHSDMGSVKKAEPSQTANGAAEILQSWQGDYPVSQLKLLPEKQRKQGVGFILNAKIFEGVWKAFSPGKGVPEIDFKTSLVLFARNTRFYNRISIGKVDVKKGVAEVLAMETMSAMPIEERVAMSIVVISRKGITGLKTGSGITSIPNL